MMQSESSSELLEGILGDAKQEAERLVEQARAQAADTLEGARDRAAKILNGAEDAAAGQGAELKKNSRSALILLKSRQELKSSRKLAAEVMRRVNIRLERLKNDGSYPDLLEKLLLEAALGLGVPEALVNGGEAERNLLKPGLLRRVESFLSKEFGVTVSLSLSDAPPMAEQGVELTDTEGRRAFRNSFTARLDRNEQQIRDMIETRLQEARQEAPAQDERAEAAADKDGPAESGEEKA